ncbi:siderophore ferric iron reductase [Caenispirillum bisanense]|uniref:siderophore ferric iron reductase n=1 Tax=Caenispirillum bisanense TaxID=414052 RepID=UPI0031DE2AF3
MTASPPLPPAVPDSPLTPLLTAAEALVPGMAGVLGGPAPGHVTAGQDNAAALTALIDAITATAGEGEAAYVAVTAWGMLVWQPAILTLLAVHRFGLVPDLGGMSQRVHGASVYGYRLPPEPAAMAMPPADLIRAGGQQLRALADSLLAELQRHVRLKPVLARRLLADRVVSTVARPEFAAAEVTALVEQWLAALDLAGCSGVMPVPLSGGRTVMALDRRACCLAYRVGGNDMCITCPRQSDSLRLERLQTYWEAHV